MSRKYKFLQPSYFDKFQCSGGDCKLNCCDYNWKITIDKETYNKYKKYKIKPISDKFKKHIKKSSKNDNDLNFATLQVNKINAFLEYKKLEKNNEETTAIGIFQLSKCPFQTEDRLCMIHKELGYDFLSRTCKVFPRNCLKIHNNYEKGLSSGCEEVSRLLYNEKDGIKFEIVEKDEPMMNNSTITFKSDEELVLFDNVRAMCISILQLPKYSIENKIILLTVFMFKISELPEEDKINETYSFIEYFSNNIEQYEKLFETSKIRNDIFLNIFIKELSSMSNFNGDFNLIKDLQIIVQKLKKCYTKEEQTKLITLQLKDGEEYYFEDIPYIKRNPLKVSEDGSVTSAKYLKYKNNTKKLMKGKEYYIENVLINSFFSNRYPANGGTLKDNCIKFVISYCFYIGLLTGFLSKEKSLDEELLHRICTVWGRKWADQSASLEASLKNLKEQGLDSLSGLIILIKSC